MIYFRWRIAENAVSMSDLDHIHYHIPTGHYMKDAVFAVYLLLLFYSVK